MRSVLLILLLAGCSPVYANPPPCHGQVCPSSPSPSIDMGRLITSGAETNDQTLEGFTNTAISTDTTIVHSGTRSFTNTATSMLYAFPQVALGTTVYLRAYFYKDSTFDSLQADNQVISINDPTPTAVATLKAQSDGTLLLKYGGSAGTTTVGSASPVLASGRWYRLEVSVQIGTGAVDAIQGMIDGVSFASGSSLAISDGAPNGIKLSSGTVHAWFDDIAVNDSNGANQNSWPGNGAEVLLLPISDSAVGTGWTLGTGTATSANGFDSVNNTPPTGVADLAAGSDPKQIRNASSNANVNYDANLTTYFNAGVGPNSVVNVLDPIVATAAPLVTGAKQGTVGIVSNPTIANVALGAGGTAGTFWSGVAGGTYPTGWKISHGTITYAPAVTVTTSPVMRITQVTASTRIAVVCFMGMYVDYTPGANLPGTGFGKTSQVRGIRATLARSDFW